MLHSDKLKMISNICQYIGKYNIIYLKVIQSISINSDLFDEKTQQFLVKYTDSVPYSLDDIDYTSLNNLSLFSNILINYTPINSGIFALVYKGYYNNEPIVVKLLKKDITTKLINCIDTLSILFYFFSYIPYLKNLNLKELLENNKEKLLGQTKCQNEINNMKLFYNFYKHFEQIIIPRVYEEFTNEEDKVVGAYIFDQENNKVKKIIAKKTILATGGIASLYLHNSNSAGSRGDGHAMAKRAGARVTNMEFIQFHPTTFYSGTNQRRFLISDSSLFPSSNC